MERFHRLVLERNRKGKELKGREGGGKMERFVKLVPERDRKGKEL